MSFGIRFNVFSSSRVQGSGREVLGGRAMVDVLEERRLLSASVGQGLPAWPADASAVEAKLDATPEKRGGPEFASGDVTAIQLGGATGPQTFSLAPIDDGSGRDNLHGSGAVLEWIEPVEAEESPSLLVAMANVDVAGRFSSGRVLTGNMSPVATMSAPVTAQVFAA